MTGNSRRGVKTMKKIIIITSGRRYGRTRKYGRKKRYGYRRR